MDSTLTSKGQVTIPKAVRERLHLEPGDRVRFFFHPDGHLAILPVLPTSALRGMLKPRPGSPVSLEDMGKAIAAGAAERFESARQR